MMWPIMSNSMIFQMRQYMCQSISRNYRFAHMYVNSLPAMSFTIQSTPYKSPYPVRALHPMIPQCRVAIESKSRYYFISFVVKLPSISCLLQKMSSVAPISLYCLSKLWSSALVSQSLILSELSTTQMTPSVCSKQFLQQERIVFCPPISQTLSLKFSYSKVLILKPKVGLISLIFSPLNFLMIVVLPALSRPNTRSRIYFYFYLVFFTIDMKPISAQLLAGEYFLKNFIIQSYFQIYKQF